MSSYFNFCVYFYLYLQSIFAFSPSRCFASCERGSAPFFAQSEKLQNWHNKLHVFRKQYSRCLLVCMLVVPISSTNRFESNGSINRGTWTWSYIIQNDWRFLAYTLNMVYPWHPALHSQTLFWLFLFTDQSLPIDQQQRKVTQHPKSVITKASIVPPC